MNILTPDVVKALLRDSAEPCITMYLPTHRRGREIEQDPIRFKNMLRVAEERLADRGEKSQDIDSLLKPARALLEDILFWKHQSDGLAVFISKEGHRIFRLPIQFDDLVVVTDRFHIKPLLPLLTGNGRFYVLVFSAKEVRLLVGSRDNVGEIDLGHIPSSLSDTFDPNAYQEHLKVYTASGSREGRRETSSRSTGRGDVDEKKELAKFFRQLDRGVCELLKDDKAPMVLVGVEYLHPIYREVSKYPQLMADGVSGNQDRASSEELHRLSWEIVRPHFEARQQRAWESFQSLHGSGKKQASAKLEDIVAAAYHGRVSTLFLARDRYCWGDFDPDTGEVTVHKREQIGGRDLLNFSAYYTMSNGGEVFAMAPEEMGEAAPIGAVLRY